MGAVKTHYDNLQVTRNASPEVIRAAYKGLTQRYHPDRHPEDRARYERVMKILNEAFEVLSDPLKRAEHDAWIAQHEAAAATPAGSSGSRDARPTGAPPVYDPPAANYADAAHAFRQSRMASAAPEPMHPVPPSTPADESAQQVATRDTGGEKPPRRHRSFRMTEPGEHDMSGWAGLGIAVAVVVAIMVAIRWSHSRAGRVGIVVGGAALVLAAIWLIAERIRKARAGGAQTKGSGFAWWLTAIVWGWLAYALTPHRGAAFAWTDYTAFCAVLVAAWIPAYGACRALLAPVPQRSLPWWRAGGWIFPVALVFVALVTIRGGGSTSFLRVAQPTSNAAFGLALAHDAGLLIGVFVGAVLVSAVLVGVGALVSAAVTRVCVAANVPRPHARVTALLAGWAVIPVAGMAVFLAKWVP